MILRSWQTLMYGASRLIWFGRGQLLRLHLRLSVVYPPINTAVLYCMVIQSGRAHASGRGSVELAGIRVFSGSARTREIEKFLADLAKRGFEKLQSRLSRLQASLGDELFDYLKSQKLGVRFLRNNIDLVDEAGYVIFRGNEADIAKYLAWRKMDDLARQTKLAAIRQRMLGHHVRYDPLAARAKGFDIPPSKPSLRPPPPGGAGTSPDFATTPQYLYNNGVNAITKIVLTGSRSIDFVAAFRNIGITDPAVMKKILRDYTWHHLDDLDPNTMQGTMQLITKKAHVATYSHFGGCHQMKSLVEMSKYR